MKVRLGYACISETLKVTSSSSYTYTNFSKEKDLKKLDKIIKSNFLALKEIIIYNIKNNIHFFRISSNLIPLATKDDVIFDYLDTYKKYYNEIGNLINSNLLRVDFHPNEYCILNSVRSEVVESSIQILTYHYNLLKYFDIKNKIIVVHIGGGTFGKQKAISRFCNNFKKLDSKIRKCIVIENDDKIFSVDDCIEIYKKIGTPIVLDYHHYLCNRDKLKLDEFIETVFNSWKEQIPKIHFSSPKSKVKKEFRSHNDFINSDDFIAFLEEIKKYKRDIDIMIEAKKKDDALFRLVRELKYKCNYTFLDDTTFII